MRNESISESDLRNRFVDLFKKSNEVSLYLEVPVFSRSVDLVMHDAVKLCIIAIEFKKHNWRRAILQAQSVAMCFDYLYVCLLKPKTKKGILSLVDACENNGVGLYLYNTQEEIFEKAIDGPMTISVWDTQKRRVIDYLEAKTYERNTTYT